MEALYHGVVHIVLALPAALLLGVGAVGLKVLVQHPVQGLAQLFVGAVAAGDGAVSLGGAAHGGNLGAVEQVILCTPIGNLFMVGAAEHARGQLVKIIADFFGVRVVRAVEGRQTFPDIIAVFLQKGLGKLVGPGNTAQKASLVGEHPLDHRSEILPDGLPVALVGGFQEGLHRFPVAGIQEGTVILKVFHLLLLEDHDAVFAGGPPR